MVRDQIIVICDRYAFSGIAFSASKGLPYEWCRSPDIGLPAPDLTLFLDISPEKARERGGYGEERYETERMQQRVGEIFERINHEMNGISESGLGKWVTIDAAHDRDTVAQVLRKYVDPFVDGIDLPMQKLWSKEY